MIFGGPRGSCHLDLMIEFSLYLNKLMVKPELCFPMGESVAGDEIVKQYQCPRWMVYNFSGVDEVSFQWENEMIMF